MHIEIWLRQQVDLNTLFLSMLLYSPGSKESAESELILTLLMSIITISSIDNYLNVT